MNWHVCNEDMRVEIMRAMKACVYRSIHVMR